ncbi:hypothetical protein Tco_1500060 [Tanacetum coccineum]
MEFLLRNLSNTHGECQTISDIQFEEMEVHHLFEIIKRLVLNVPKKLYYCVPGTDLGSADGNLPKDDEQVSEDDRDLSKESDPKYVDFHTEGEQNVVLEKLTIDDPFLTKLVGKGNFIGKRDDPIPPLRGTYILEKDDLDNDEIDTKYKIRNGVQYPLYNPYTPWKEFQPILGMTFKSPKQLKLAPADYGVAHGYSLWYYRWIVRLYANEIVMNPALTYKFIKEDIREKYMIDVSEGQCKRAKQCAVYEHEGGLIEHYDKL